MSMIDNSTNVSTGCLFILLAMCAVISCEQANSDETDVVKNERCARFSKWPENVVKLRQSGLGEDCIVKSDLQGRKMYNEEGLWDCLQCCEDHHWNGTECKPCPPGSKQRRGVLEHCVYKEESSHPLDIPKDGEELDHDKVTAVAGEMNDLSPGKVKVENLTSNSADVTWDNICQGCADDVNFEILIHEDDGGMMRIKKVINLTQSNYSVTGLKPGVNYCVEIRASNPPANGLWNESVRFQTKTIALDDTSQEDKDFTPIQASSTHQSVIEVSEKMWTSGIPPKVPENRTWMIAIPVLATVFVVVVVVVVIVIIKRDYIWMKLVGFVTWIRKHIAKGDSRTTGESTNAESSDALMHLSGEDH